MEPNQNKASGLLFLLAIDFLKNKKGEEGLTLLKERYQHDLIYDKHSMYPLDLLTQLQRDVLIIIYGEEQLEQGYFELGKYTFDSYTHTLIGSTLTNMTITQEDVLVKILDLWNTVINFGKREVIDVKLEIGEATVSIENDPRDSNYLKGVLEQGITAIGGKNTHSEVINQGDQAYRIKLTWQN